MKKEKKITRESVKNLTTNEAKVMMAIVTAVILEQNDGQERNTSPESIAKEMGMTVTEVDQALYGLAEKGWHKMEGME